MAEAYVDTVRAVAERLMLLDGSGALVMLDSLALIDLVSELEASTGITIPASAIRSERFETLEKAAEVLESLAEARPLADRPG